MLDGGDDLDKLKVLCGEGRGGKRGRGHGADLLDNRVEHPLNVPHHLGQVHAIGLNQIKLLLEDVRLLVHVVLQQRLLKVLLKGEDLRQILKGGPQHGAQLLQVRDDFGAGLVHLAARDGRVDGAADAELLEPVAKGQDAGRFGRV